MPIYQSSVLKKFQAAQDEAQIKEAFETFSAYFLDPAIQENIRNSKEEQFQEGFLRELFVNILGYTINPNPDYNLTTELKNIKDAKKTDGAILKDGNALAVIELKGTDTKDLDKVTDQAFNYKNNQPVCVYVVTSNFEKLRFYIHNMVEHVEFNLFTLTLDQFKLLWLFLQKDNLLGGIPAKVKEESLLEEEKVTKRLYKDYSAFKNDLWTDMCQNNPEADELELYKKSQKLLDRFLFIFFAEDKGLLPPNSISVIIGQWRKLKELDEYKPLYSRFQKYFGYMNDGYKGAKYEIHAYNGGLFKADPLLDGLTITDEVLEKHVLKLTEYDFETEVDTNILGHIFEHSLNDIENVRAQLAGEEVDKSKTKRKKDGVFYTPKYITKYIVDNTVGKLCEEKKQELGIDEEEFAKDRKGRKKATILKLDAQLKAYREWLLQLTICDPACGSGAFLNQALEFLMAEHRYVDELESQLLGYAMVFQDVENHILERNIYGVDINEESVEIARLSLWLRTAKKGRKLTSLSSNIKVGNSLIDDPEVAGELAFNWQEQFPTVFPPSKGEKGDVKGGFDVVIGNPPYVFTRGGEFTEEAKNYIMDYVLEKSIETTSRGLNIQKGKINLFAVFTVKALDLLSSTGYQSFIIPNNILRATPYEAIRKHLIEQSAIVEIIDLGKDVFEDATVSTVVLTLANRKQKDLIRIIKSIEDFASGKFEIGQIEQQSFANNENYVFNILVDQRQSKIISKIEKNATSLGEFFKYISPGIDGDKKKYVAQSALTEEYKPLLYGKSFTRYGVRPSSNFIHYKKELLNRARKEEIYLSDKIILQRISGGKSPLTATIDTNQYYTFNSVNNLVLNAENSQLIYDFLGLLNSRLLNWYYGMKFSNQSELTVNISKTFLQVLPIKKFPERNREKFEALVKSISSKTQKLIDLKAQFLDLLQARVELADVSRSLENWPELDFKGFMAELKKKKVKLSLEEEAEWMQYFNKKKTEANALQAEIDRIDKAIDQMVYELYGLTQEEIEIVENA